MKRLLVLFLAVVALAAPLAASTPARAYEQDPGSGGCGSYHYRCETNWPDYWNNTCFYEDACGHRIYG